MDHNKYLDTHIEHLLFGCVAFDFPVPHCGECGRHPVKWRDVPLCSVVSEVRALEPADACARPRPQVKPDQQPQASKCVHQED